MGVRFLQTFITKKVPNGVIDIDMKKEVEQYKLNNNIENPTIVVDLLCLSTDDCVYVEEILLGGRHKIYAERFRAMFEKLKSIGVNLVFFVDGIIQKTKIPTCLDRKNNIYEQQIKVLNAISEDNLKIIDDLIFTSGANFNSILVSIASNFGKIYSSKLNECDLELAKFAYENNAMAIISNDTDFLIFEGNWQIWSSEIDFDKLTTKKYNKDSLYKTLGLSAKQMPIFATLAGNDIMQYDLVKHYHWGKRRQGTHFYCIADVIKNLEYNSQTIAPKNIWELSRLIFTSHYKRSEGAALIRDSLNSYDYSKCIEEYENDLIKEASGFNYYILTDNPDFVELIYFDLSKSDFIPFYSMVSPILKRSMGILLYDKKCDPHIKRVFYTKTSHSHPYKKIFEKPEYPKCEVPDVLELISEPMGTNPELDKVRYNLLCWTLSTKLNPDSIQDLPSQSLLDVLTLFYLCELKQITVQEADCILLACHTTGIPDDEDTLIDEFLIKLNERDARIAFLFPVIRLYVDQAMCAVGLTNENICTDITFDGLYFHYFRKTWDTESIDYQNIHLKGYEKLRLYAETQ